MPPFVRAPARGCGGVDMRSSGANGRAHCSPAAYQLAAPTLPLPRARQHREGEEMHCLGAGTRVKKILMVGVQVRT